VERLVAKDRFIYDPDNPGDRLALREAARDACHGPKDDRPGVVHPAEGHTRPKTGQETLFRLHLRDADGEVEVDMRTGEVTVKRMAAAFDIGKAITPCSSKPDRRRHRHGNWVCLLER